MQHKDAITTTRDGRRELAKSWRGRNGIWPQRAEEVGRQRRVATRKEDGMERLRAREVRRRVSLVYITK
jgi:hypothetical protein